MRNLFNRPTGFTLMVGQRGLSTLEWLIIAIIALLMISYVMGYWGSIWGAVTAKAEVANRTLLDALK